MVEVSPGAALIAAGLVSLACGGLENGSQAIDSSPLLSHRLNPSLWSTLVAFLVATHQLEGLPGLAVATGNLFRTPDRGDFGLRVSHLSALSALKAVQGGLVVVENPALTSLARLDSLATVGLDLHVLDDPAPKSGPPRLALANRDGLQSVPFVGSDLVVFQNPSLRRVAGLHKSLQHSFISIER